MHCCRRCHSCELYWSHRQGLLDWLLFFCLLRPVRCYQCSRRFYRSIFFAAKLPPGGAAARPLPMHRAPAQHQRVRA